jgi:SAM-dependent methyltransferase
VHTDMDEQNAKLSEMMCTEQYLGKQYLNKGMVNVNLGCGHRHLDNFINVDREIPNEPDILCDLDKPDVRLPFPDNYVDNLVAIHFLEHVWNIMPLWREIYRICKPDSKCFFITPYWTCYDALCNPFHYRSFDEVYWHYLNPNLYKTKGSAGYADHGVDFNFKVSQIWLIPYPEFFSDPELDFKKRHQLNIIREIHALLEVKK